MTARPISRRRDTSRHPRSTGRQCCAAIAAAVALEGCATARSRSTPIHPTSPSGVANVTTQGVISEPPLPGQPGVITLLRLAVPAGSPKSATLVAQRTLRNGHPGLCLYTDQVSYVRGRPMGHSEGHCIRAVEPADRAFVMVATAGWCAPKAIELVWGIAARDARLSLLSPSGRRGLSSLGLPAGLHLHGELFYGFVDAAPVTLEAQAIDGQLIASELINRALAPYGWGPRTVGPAPTSQPALPKS